MSLLKRKFSRQKEKSTEEILTVDELIERTFRTLVTEENVLHDAGLCSRILFEPRLTNDGNTGRIIAPVDEADNDYQGGFVHYPEVALVNGWLLAHGHFRPKKRHQDNHPPLLLPVIEYVEELPHHKLRAHFGYHNYVGKPVTVPKPSKEGNISVLLDLLKEKKNYFITNETKIERFTGKPSERLDFGQPSEFIVADNEDYYVADAFTVDFERHQTISWYLTTPETGAERVVTASNSTPRSKNKGHVVSNRQRIGPFSTVLVAMAYPGDDHSFDGNTLMNDIYEDLQTPWNEIALLHGDVPGAIFGEFKYDLAAGVRNARARVYQFHMRDLPENKRPQLLAHETSIHGYTASAVEILVEGVRKSLEMTLTQEERAVINNNKEYIYKLAARD